LEIVLVEIAAGASSGFGSGIRILGLWERPGLIKLGELEMVIVKTIEVGK
jgi:hypothetical protein